MSFETQKTSVCIIKLCNAGKETVAFPVILPHEFLWTTAESHPCPQWGSEHIQP